MPRKPRIEYSGAIYHVMSRGNRQEAIFWDSRDCEMFLETLDEACDRTGWRIHAFCLMGNHYHFLLETPEPNLVSGMKWLQGTYTQRFNIRHEQRGHLFQGRYKALPIDGADDDCFKTVSSYIHLNPARAKLFDLTEGNLSDYRWSSYPLYSHPSKRPAWLNVDRTLGSFGLSDDTRGRRLFREHMQKRVLELACSDRPWEVDGQWARIRRGWYVGSDAFRDELQERLKKLSGQRTSYTGEEIRLHDEMEADRLFREGLCILEMDEDELRNRRKGAPEKALLAWLIRRHTMVANAWIAERLNMGRADCLSRYPKSIDDTADENLIETRERLKKITKLRD